MCGKSPPPSPTSPYHQTTSKATPAEEGSPHSTSTAWSRQSSDVGEGAGSASVKMSSSCLALALPTHFHPHPRAPSSSSGQAPISGSSCGSFSQHPARLPGKPGKPSGCPGVAISAPSLLLHHLWPWQPLPLCLCVFVPLSPRKSRSACLLLRDSTPALCTLSHLFSNLSTLARTGPGQEGREK